MEFMLKPVEAKARERAPELPKAPKHLKAATRRWWREVIESWELEAHHLKLLTLAAQAWDRAEQARESLATHGLVFEGPKGRPTARPEVAIERDSRLAFARLLRELDLDVSPPAAVRPPALRSNRG